MLSTFCVPSSQLILIKLWYGKVYYISLRDRKVMLKEIFMTLTKIRVSEWRSQNLDLMWFL